LGKAIVPTLTKELQNEFQTKSGFATTSLWNMVQFYIEYKSDLNPQPLVGELRLSNHIVLLQNAETISQQLLQFLGNKSK